MQNHVRLVASSHASENREHLVRLLEMGRRTAGFDPDRSVRAREVRSAAADGSKITVTVLFLRTGKESVLETIENWFFSRSDRKLGREIVDAAFPDLAGAIGKTSFPPWLGTNRITVKDLDGKVTPDNRISAAFSVSCQEAAAAFHAVLGGGSGVNPSSGQVCLAESTNIYIRSCLGLSARSRMAQADKMHAQFIQLVGALRSADWTLYSLDTRQRLVKQARDFCTAWSGHKARNRERHAHTVRTGNLVRIDKLVDAFEKSFPA